MRVFIGARLLAVLLVLCKIFFMAEGKAKGILKLISFNPGELED